MNRRWLFAAAAIFVIATSGHAQIVGGFGPRPMIGLQVRNGSLNTFAVVGGGWGYGRTYGSVPAWYYGPSGIPVVTNPFNGQPVIIQNIIQVPGAAAPGRAGFVPPDLDAPAAKPAARAGKVAAAARPVGPMLAPEAPKMLAAQPGRADADRIAEMGRKAFTDGQFGRALELFRRAAEITPNEPSAHYLIAQAEFAIGKYREAVAAIAAGMALRADWPEARFVSRDLYWKDPNQFDDHVKALRQAVAAFPNDAGLLFVLGHQLWFDGKRDEARPMFQKAAALAKGQTPAEAFLLK